MRPSSFLPAAVLVALAAACSSTPGSDGSGPADAAPDGLVTCNGDPLAMVYTENLSVTGSSHVFQVVLVSSDPAPPARGNDTWTIRVLDSSGNPVPNPTVSVTPYMPRHGHGTSILVSVTTNPDGTFTLTPLNLFMPGLWTITINVTAGSQTDSAVFGFCIPG